MVRSQRKWPWSLDHWNAPWKPRLLSFSASKWKLPWSSREGIRPPGSCEVYPPARLPGWTCLLKVICYTFWFCRFGWLWHCFFPSYFGLFLLPISIVMKSWPTNASSTQQHDPAVADISMELCCLLYLFYYCIILYLLISYQIFSKRGDDLELSHAWWSIFIVFDTFKMTWVLGSPLRERGTKWTQRPTPEDTLLCSFCCWSWSLFLW